MASDRLQVTVRSREGVVWEGELAAVSSHNRIGAFDVLPKHANFVAVISGKLVLRKLDGGKQEYNVEKGIIAVERNQVKVFLGVGKI